MTGRMVRALAVALVLVLASGAALAADEQRGQVRPVAPSDDLLVVLVIGSDAGPPYRPGDPRRGLADAIHLVAVDTEELRATVVDIPRDSVVGGTKVNSYLASGGPTSLVSRLEALTGVAIDHWILTSFKGWERISSAVGGIDVTVDVPMHDDASKSDFDRGQRRVKGKSALAFARDRHSLPDGDFGRTRHQGDLLLGVHREATGGAGLASLVDTVGAIARNTASDISPGKLLRLALLAGEIDPGDVAHVSLEGRLGVLNGASVVYLEPGNAFRRIRRGQVGPRGS